jgi:hypothetical protein
MKWFSRKPAPPPPTANESGAVNLQSLGSILLQAISGLENATVDLELLRARVADLCRDQQAEPPDPDRFMADAGALDVESQRRLAIAVQGLGDESARAAFHRDSAANSAARVADLFAFARRHLLLTASLLMESALRREEFARHFIAHLGGEVLGESPNDSRDRLRRLDYGMLLAEAERAKLSAGERVAYLRRLQEEQEQKLGRRSKF